MKTTNRNEKRGQAALPQILRLLALAGALLMMLMLFSSCGEKTTAQIQNEISENYLKELDADGDGKLSDEEKAVLESDEALQKKIWDAEEEKKGINNESFWDILQVPFGWLLDFCNRICFSNYLLAMLLFTILMKIVLLPSGIKQQKNMVKQASFAPKQRAIQKKYAGRTDRATQQQMQQELMDAQREAGISTFGGCLGLFWQFPVLICLYAVIRSPLRYLSHLTSVQTELLRLRAAVGGFEGADQMKLVSHINEHSDAFGDLIGNVKLPSFSVFGLDLSQFPSFSPESPILWLLLIIPVLTFVSYFFSMKLTRKLSYQPPVMEGQPDAQKSMQIMDWVMPLFSVYISFSVPALLGVYWIYQSAIGILQSYLLKKKYPYPEFSEEEYKEAERLYSGKKAKKSASNEAIDPNRPKPRSLHHIDDDDEDELPEQLMSAPVSSKYGDEDDISPATPTPMAKAPLKDGKKKAKDKAKEAKNAENDEDKPTESEKE